MKVLAILEDLDPTGTILSWHRHASRSGFDGYL